MPNHVYCTISTQQKQTLKLLHNTSKDLTGGLAMLLMPRPREKDEDWYNWNIEHWGTKWGFYEQTLDGTDESHTIGTLDFTTAWGPPSKKLIKKLAQRFPDLHFLYEEEQGWGGELQYDRGKLVEEKEWDIPSFKCFGDRDTELNYNGKTIYPTYLQETHDSYRGVYKKGWYEDYDLEYPILDEDEIKFIEESLGSV